MPHSIETERVIVQQTADEVQALGEQLADSDPDRARDLQGGFDHKLGIYERQVMAFKNEFPETIDARIFEASLLGYQALAKLHRTGLARTAARAIASGTQKAAASGFGGGLMGASLKLSAAIIGGTVAAGTALVARQQEKAETQEALNLLDRALSIIDIPGPHLTKAHIYAAIDRADEAVGELEHIIANFPGDATYVVARQMKDELLTPKKRKWFVL